MAIPKFKVVDTVQTFHTALALQKREKMITSYLEQGQQFNLFEYSFIKYVFISYSDCADCLWRAQFNISKLWNYKSQPNFLILKFDSLYGILPILKLSFYCFLPFPLQNQHSCFSKGVFSAENYTFHSTNWINFPLLWRNHVINIHIYICTYVCMF